MLLADRPLLGYPGATVELHVEGAIGDNYRVLVRDSVRCLEWETRSKRDAADRYFHPFVFGYSAPTFDNLDTEDGA
jgi:hypothetical protein